MKEIFDSLYNYFFKVEERLVIITGLNSDLQSDIIYNLTSRRDGSRIPRQDTRMFTFYEIDSDKIFEDSSYLEKAESIIFLVDANDIENYSKAKDYLEFILLRKRKKSRVLLFEDFSKITIYDEELFNSMFDMKKIKKEKDIEVEHVRGMAGYSSYSQNVVEWLLNKEINKISY